MKPLLLLLLLFAPRPQAQPAAPAFDVASVKLHESGPGGYLGVRDGGVQIQGVALDSIIRDAWQVSPAQVSGMPSWADSDRYDISAKAADHAASQSELRVMLQNLLIARFHMDVHMTRAEQEAYVLTLEPGARSRLGPSSPETPDGLAAQNCKFPAVPTPGEINLVCKATMDSLATLLPLLAPRYFDHPAVNQTGVPGIYPIDLKFARNPEDTAPGPSLFDALKGIGIRAQEKKVLLPMLVIGHIDRAPVEN